MKQFVCLTYWHHEVCKYASIEECVNAWLRAHPKAELVSCDVESDPTFFKGTLYKAHMIVSTPKPIPEDDFQCMEPDPEREKVWDDFQETMKLKTSAPRKTWRQCLAAWIAG